MENKTKMVYSLNLAAYISMRTCLTPEIYRDKEGLYYCVFPEIRGVAYAIREWKNSDLKVTIHEFLDIYRQLRQAIAEKRREEGDFNGSRKRES